MIKILHLQTDLNLACGVTRTISQIIRYSSPEFEHHLIALGGDGLKRFTDIGIKPIILKVKRDSLVGTIKIFLALIKFCRINSIQIIHSHHRYFDTISWVTKVFISIKTITSVQSKVDNHKLLSYKSDILIACSNSIKAHLISEFKIVERRIKVIYNSVDPKEVVLTKTKTELMNFLKIPSNKFVIGYYGRLDFKEKGIDVLLDAFLNLSKLNKELLLLLVGNGIDENKIREFITQNELRVKVLDSQEEIINYYQLLDLFVLPSRIEPFGIVILEAGISKIPFIGSNVDGIAELIENEKDGLLFKSGDFDDLQNKILKIYNDKRYADQLAENLYRKVLEGYTINSIIPKYVELYLSLYNEK